MIRSDERGFLGPHSSITFPIEFTAPIAGTFQEEYTLVFDQNHPEVFHSFLRISNRYLFSSFLATFHHSCTIIRCSCLDRKSFD